MGGPAGLFTVLHTALCALGFALCCYAYYVETAKTVDDDFEAMCDFSPEMSCSAVLTSKYGRGMGIVGTLLGDNHPLNLSNAIYGAVLYPLLAILGQSCRLRLLVVWLLGLTTLGVLYLACVLHFVLKEFCVLCLSLDVVHLLLLLVAVLRWLRIQHSGDSKPKRT